MKFISKVFLDLCFYKLPEKCFMLYAEGIKYKYAIETQRSSELWLSIEIESGSCQSHYSLPRFLQKFGQVSMKMLHKLCSRSPN